MAHVYLKSWIFYNFSMHFYVYYLLPPTKPAPKFSDFNNNHSYLLSILLGTHQQGSLMHLQWVSWLEASWSQMSLLTCLTCGQVVLFLFHTNSLTAAFQLSQTGPWGLDSEIMQCHFCSILLIKVSTNTLSLTVWGSRLFLDGRNFKKIFGHY